MSRPEDLPRVKRFLGMVQYLGKFLPPLSNVTHPLRQLERQDVTWHQTDSRDAAISKTKHLIANAPVLRYFDPTLDVTIQANACMQWPWRSSITGRKYGRQMTAENGYKSLVTISKKPIANAPKWLISQLFLCKCNSSF